MTALAAFLQRVKKMTLANHQIIPMVAIHTTMLSNKMICKKCGKVTDDRCFGTYKARNGEMRRRGVCKDCRGQYCIENFEARQAWRKTYNAKNRSVKRQRDFDRRQSTKAVIDKIKAETPCADCKRFFPPVAMDFDHVHGKNRGIAGMVSAAYKLELILEEIKLCDIVCACCHRVRTAKRKENHSQARAAEKITMVV